jgi:2-keto-3-deoxy-L-rhamnonate aldolase RhmA
MDPGLVTRAFRADVLAGRRLLGTVIASPDPALAELAADRFDFLWVDLEHSALTIGDVLRLCIAARASGCPAIVRIPHPASELLPALLDAGVSGIVAPRVDDPAVAAAFAAGLRYPPHGTRGVADRRASGYGLVPRAMAPDEAPVCLVQVESGLAVRRAEELAGVEGVDGLIVGPNDLAFDLGVPPGLETPELLTAIDSVRRAAARAGAVCGLAAGGPLDAIVRALGDDATLLAYSADVRIYARALADVASQVAERWPATARPAQEPGVS